MPRNPYDVQGAVSENRWRQPAAELFGPVPCSVAHVAISTGGKTSQMLTIADALLPVMDRVVIFSHSHRLDPAFGSLKQKIEENIMQRGENPQTHPCTFDNLQSLPKVLADHRRAGEVEIPERSHARGDAVEEDVVGVVVIGIRATARSPEYLLPFCIFRMCRVLFSCRALIWTRASAMDTGDGTWCGR